VSPAFNHTRKEIRSARIEGGVKSKRNFEGGRGGHAMGLWRREVDAILEALSNRNVVPGKEFERIQMVGDGERIQFVKAWDGIVIFDVREATQVEDKFRPAALRGKLETDAFYVPVS